MSEKRSDEQIAAEVRTLRAYRERIPKKNAFGDSNLDLIDAEIAVLDGTRRADDFAPDTSSPYYEEKHHEVHNSALEAERWRDGEAEEPPSVGWEPILRPEAPEDGA